MNNGEPTTTKNQRNTCLIDGPLDEPKLRGVCQWKIHKRILRVLLEIRPRIVPKAHKKSQLKRKKREQKILYFRYTTTRDRAKFKSNSVHYESKIDLFLGENMHPLSKESISLGAVEPGWRRGSKAAETGPWWRMIVEEGSVGGSGGLQPTRPAPQRWRL